MAEDEWAGWGSISLHRAKDGRIRYRLRGWLDGERQPFGLYDTRDEAEAERLSLIEVLRVERGDAGAGLTLRAWGEKWLNRRETIDKVRGIKSERSCWRTHVASSRLGAMLLRSIKRTDVVRWMQGLQETTAKHRNAKTKPTRSISRQTIVHARRLLIGALAAAADAGHLSINVAAGVAPPKPTPRDRDPWTFLTVDEISAIAKLPVLPSSRARIQGHEQALRLEQRAVFLVAIYTGLRAGELWGLRWCDVDLTETSPQLHVRRSYRGPTKGGKPRRVPLLRQAREALLEWQARAPGIGEALVFPADGGGCHYKGYDAGWEKARRTAGIDRPVRFHDLRHTNASHLVMGSWGRAWELTEVRDVLGHSSITVTERYAHLSPKALQKARAETDAAGPVGGHSVATAEILDLRAAREKRSEDR